jgi:hypothetical protein
MFVRLLIGVAVAASSSAALGRNIVLTNDDGLSSNVKALYEALKGARPGCYRLSTVHQPERQVSRNPVHAAAGAASGRLS